MSSMKPWMEGIGDVDLDKSPDDELSPELQGAIRRLSETLKKLDLQALASNLPVQFRLSNEQTAKVRPAFPTVWSRRERRQCRPLSRFAPHHAAAALRWQVRRLRSPW